MADTSELLLLCADADLITPEMVKKAADAGERVGWETVLTPNAQIYHRTVDLQKYEAALNAALPDLLAGLKSRLQAEVAPTDAEVAEIEKRASVPLRDVKVTDWDHWMQAIKDRRTLLAKLRTLTSQAEAQAPALRSMVSAEELRARQALGMYPFEATTAPAPVDARLMEDEQDAYDLAARYASKNSDFPAELFARLVCVIDRLLSSPKAVAPSTTKEGRG